MGAGPECTFFAAAGELASKGGDVHFDTEGLSESQIAKRSPALSLVLMLQPPESGGGLRIWDRFYDGNDFPDLPGPSVPTACIQYLPGELVIFDSYRLHQIQGFRGPSDRISATMHVAVEDGRWEAWF